MINEFGIRLRSARKMAGMSMAELAEKAGAIVSKQAISKYEKGQIKPGSEVVLALARALNLKADYFFRFSRVAIDGLEFRKKSRLSKKSEEQIKYQTLDFLQKYLELEDILGIPPGFDNPITDNKIRCYEDVERVAWEIREKWKLGEGPVPHLIELLEDKGFKVFEVADFEHFDGLSGFASGMDIPVIAAYKDSNLVRKRFTVAHEMAHLLLDFSESEEESTEKLCHAFAGALLLPENIMRAEMGEKRNKITEWELKKLKGIFGISMQAIMARALRLEIISANAYRLFFIYAGKHGWRKEEPGRYEGREVANRFKQLVYHAAAEQIISFSKAAELLNKSVAEFDREVHFVA
ncbi:MAG: helix-turn-helix domain-containing protein [Thermodesulfobacteriota bacterium]